MDIMDIMDFMDIMDMTDIMIITAWMAMAGAVSALVLTAENLENTESLPLLYGQIGRHKTKSPDAGYTGAYGAMGHNTTRPEAPFKIFQYFKDFHFLPPPGLSESLLVLWLLES